MVMIAFHLCMHVGAIPTRGNDGARLRDDSGDHALFIWILHSPCSRTEDGRHLPPVI